MRTSPLPPAPAGRPASFLLPAASLAILGFLGCSSGNDWVGITRVIGPDGGVLELVQGPLAGTSLQIPAGALAEPARITLGEGPDVAWSGYQALGPGVSVRSEGPAFLAPVTLTLRYDASRIPSGLGHGSVTVLEEDGAGTVIVDEPDLHTLSDRQVSVHLLAPWDLQPAVAVPFVTAPLLTSRAALPANPEFTPVPWRVVPPLLPPRSDKTFLWSGFNVDGTLAANPVVYESTLNTGNLAFTLRRLRDSSTVPFAGASFTVYSAVPEPCSTDYAYLHPGEYFKPGDPNKVTGTLNGGNRSAITPSAVPSAFAPDEAAFLVTGADDARHVFPNLPNGRDAAGNELDHRGLTEHVAWTVNPYAYTAYQEKDDSGKTTYQLFSRGWAVPATHAGQGVEWKKLKVDAKGNEFPDGLSKMLYPASTTDGDTLLHTITLSTLVDDLAALLKDVEDRYINAPHQIKPFWLAHGAFVTYQPMPGFQRNLIRKHTPVGSYTLAENTSDLFARAGGGVEVPAVVTAGGGAVQPHPLVVQTWTKDQDFVLVNNLRTHVPSTQDQYPGEEAYYLGNTFLPGKAGVVTTWQHYPKMVGNIPDERDSDSWLGLAGDSPWDVMAWNMGDRPNSLGIYEQGAQARKPYMFGASVQMNDAGDPRTIRKLRLEHSNTFWWYQVPGDDDSLARMYAATLYIDAGGRNGYVPVVKISYDWQPWWFKRTAFPLDKTHVITGDDGKTTVYDIYTWLERPAGQVLGTWVPRYTWILDADAVNDLDNFPVVDTVGGGWEMKTVSSPTTSGSLVTICMVSGAQAGSVTVSLTANQADIAATNSDPQGIAWHGADLPDYQPPHKDKAFDYRLQDNPVSGHIKPWPVVRYTLTAVTFDPVDDGRHKVIPRSRFLIALSK